MIAVRAIAVAVLAVWVSACAVGPNYKRPELPVPAEYRGDMTAAEAASFADLPWWEIFDDVVLQDLIAESLQNNLNVLTAAARVEQARAFVGESRAQFAPQIGYGGSASRGRSPVSNTAEDYATFNTFLAGLNLAWEIDVWGRIRRSNEAARAQLMATEEFRRGVLLSLVSSVASSYFELLELDRELEIAENAAQTFRETRDLFGRRFKGGVASKLQTSRAEASLADAEAAIPALRTEIWNKENQISILLGRLPGSIARGKTLDEQPGDVDIPAGLPSALLERRPDIRQAEEQLIAANALIGVSVANFFPRIGLTSLYGGTSNDIDDLLKGSSNIWNVAGQAAGPLFQGGALIAQYEGQKAAWQAETFEYENTVLTAFAEVSNSLAAESNLAKERVHRERAVTSLKTAVDISLKRYKEGLASYYEVLEAQQQLFPAENVLAEVRLDQLLTVVELYRVLGGGWNLDESWLPPPATTVDDPN